MESSGSEFDEESEMADVRKLRAVLEAEPSTSAAGLQPSAGSASAREQLSRIETAMSLNKATDEKLRELEGMLTAKLQECRQRLKDIEASPGTSTGEKSDKPFRYINCGKPYFKGPDNFPAPDNEDTILMAKCKMYDYTSVTPVSSWTIKDKSEFNAIIHSMSVDIKKKELNSKISQLQRESKGKESKGKGSKGKGKGKGKTTKPDHSKDKEIAAIRKELCNLNKKSISELALPIDEEYDWDMVAIKTNQRHSPQEYRSFWKLYLHPSINKSTWTKTEHIELQKVAHANDLQDWDKIAEELGTGRTGYQCFVYYRTNMSNTFTGQKWSKEEEEYLKRLIGYFREGDYIPWGKITSYMEKRTKIQIYNKYLRLMEQRKGRFLPEEDAVVLTCVQKFGPNFRKVMKYLPGRSMSQLRARYNVLCTGRRTKTSIVWSGEEDKKLIQLMANQDAIINYSSLTQHFRGKDRAHIRARYTTLLKWMKKHPNMDISKAPRRGARRLGHGEASQDLNKAVENLKKRMQSEVENKKSTKIHKDSSEADIDNAIVQALIDEMDKEDQEQKSKLCDAEQSVLKEHWEVPSTPTNITNLQKTLILLKAKLDKGKFQNSYAAKLYPELLQDIQERRLPVKSYSKSSKVEVVNVETPDIWGNNTLTTSEYVFPPNYSTITACRKLMAYASASTTSQEERPAQLGIQARRNIVLKEQLDILLERFNTLFVWPMLLSNESPGETQVRQVPKANPPEKAIVMSGDPGIAIPIVCSRNKMVNENINLVESAANEDDITMKNMYVGNDDYLFLKQ